VHIFKGAGADADDTATLLLAFPLRRQVARSRFKFEKLPL
jgi:hypothetical protein